MQSKMHEGTCRAHCTTGAEQDAQEHAQSKHRRSKVARDKAPQIARENAQTKSHEQTRTAHRTGERAQHNDKRERRANWAREPAQQSALENLNCKSRGRTRATSCTSQLAQESSRETFCTRNVDSKLNLVYEDSAVGPNPLNENDTLCLDERGRGSQSRGSCYLLIHARPFVWISAVELQNSGVLLLLS